MLRRLVETSEAGRKAASSLKESASVEVRFTGVPGDFRFHAVNGKPRFEAGRAEEPDFELTLPPGAVRDICERRQEDTGDLGILFLQHIFANEAEQKIQVKLHSGLIRLTLHGWLGVVASGCPKVVLWLAQRGLKGPSAVASLFSRLKKG
jgi:hypothetical protein